jgi:hypothetical protein
LSCFDSSGAFQWAVSWQGSAQDGAYDACTDSSGNVYVTGDFGYFFGGTIDIDPGPGTDIRDAVSWYDIWLCKLDPSGSFLWGRTWGGDMGEGGYSLDTDESDNVYLAGYFRSNVVDFDPGPGTDIHTNAGLNGEADIFLCKFTSGGILDWAQTWGSAGQDIGYDVVAPCPSVAYLTGVYCGMIDFNPDSGADQHTSIGGEDAFCMKILSDGSW